MFLWFAGMSFVLVWEVFRSPALDYRLVMAGAVLPVVEVAFGGPRVLHTLLAAVLVLGVVMLATRQRRLLRRRWLGIPIGLFMHLVLDGIWTNSRVFWWPFLGWSFGSAGMPEVDRGAASLLMEVVGAAALLWCGRRFGLEDRRRRAEFWRTGRIGRDLVG